MKRQIILDTETTGINPKEGHRLIEIGCVEMIDRQLTGNNFHMYVQPDREVEQEAIDVHGITNEFLVDKPRFHEIVYDLVEYLRGAELVIHNAPFDVGFLNHEYGLVDTSIGTVNSMCSVVDTLVMARSMFPGQRNSLDALCKRYDVDNSNRTLHGALLDAEILADVYLAMTGGQVSLSLESAAMPSISGSNASGSQQRTSLDLSKLRVIRASEDELSAHNERIAAIEKSSGVNLWQ